MTHHKDARVGGTVRFQFTTNGADGGAIAPASAFEAADVVIYKDGSATQRTSTAGFTMTSPFDSVVGLHQIAVDTSDNTDAGFYAVGSEYMVTLQPDEQVDGVTVVAVIGSFRIVAAESSAGVPKVDVTHFGGTAATASGGRPEVNTTHVSGATTSVSTMPASIATILADLINGGRLDLLIDAIKAVTDALPDAGALTSLATAASIDALPTAAEVTTAVLAGAASTPIDANVKEVNDVALTGDGTSGTPWGPA